MKPSDVSLHYIDTIYESDFDDENFSGTENSIERRRKSHTEAEQRRRNNMNSAYDALRELVCTQKASANSSPRMSKLATLNTASSELGKLMDETLQKQKMTEQLLRKAHTMRLINAYYEKVMPAPIKTNSCGAASEEIKLWLFQRFSASLFESFSLAVNNNSFPELTTSILGWLESSCDHKSLHTIMDSIMQASNTQDRFYSCLPQSLSTPSSSSNRRDSDYPSSTPASSVLSSSSSQSPWSHTASAPTMDASPCLRRPVHSSEPLVDPILKDYNSVQSDYKAKNLDFPSGFAKGSVKSTTTSIIRPSDQLSIIDPIHLHSYPVTEERNLQQSTSTTVVQRNCPLDFTSTLQ